jgi:hypothetical protein
MPAAVGVAAVLGCAAALAQQGRDRPVEPTGTAVIAGAVVTDTETAVPLRRAVVTVTGGGLSSSRSAITDDDGRFAIGGLPGGRYAISATKAAYLESAYGARRPGRPGTPLSLADGQRADIVIRMPRGAVVQGVVRDENGQPLAGVDVYAVNPKSPGSIGLSLTPRTDKVTTDDRGGYRIYGLAPGEYVIAATFEVLGSGDIGRRRDAEVDALLEAARRRGPVIGAPPPPPPPAQTVGYPLTYYPGVPVFASALRVTLAAGDERVGLDFPLVPVSVATVEGSVVRADGQPPTTVRLSLNVDGPPTFSTGSRPILSTPPGPDGRFKYSSMAPGHYTLYARAGGPATRGVTGGGRAGGPPAGAPTPGGPTEIPLFAIAEFDVTGQDISGLTLVLEPGATLAGRVEFDGASPPPEDLTGLRVRAAVPGRTGYSASSGGTTMGTAIVAVAPVSVSAGGAFEVRGLAPGQYRLSATVPPDISERWLLRSATFEGRDLLDDTVDVRGSDITGVAVRFTDRRSELAGTLQSAAGLPAPDYFVVVFPSDRALWRAGSRRIASTRPDTTGAFSIRDLPGGAYLLAALTDLEPADLEDPAFLEEMAAQSVPVTIVDGQRTVQDIRIAR